MRTLLKNYVKVNILAKLKLRYLRMFRPTIIAKGNPT